MNYFDFVLNTQYEDIPDPVIDRVQDLILDLIGVSAAAHDITAARLARDSAVRFMSASTTTDSARILFDGRTASQVGAAFAGATQIDNLDAHDGFSSAKGHAGCALFPAALAFVENQSELSGRDFLVAMVIGYEIACRGALALHGTVSDYHTSGAWVALAVAAVGIRLNNSDENTLRQAIGIAEYHGPRSQMMREIDNPTMLNDGSGWGSMTGVMSAQLALSGFEGAPAITVEANDTAHYWHSLGSEWLTLKQNIKLFPVCRWAHAPIQAALDLRQKYSLSIDDIASIEIHAFAEATRLAKDIPATTGKAQYSIFYPVAAALRFGQLGPREVAGDTFNDEAIAKLVAISSVTECEECNKHFPEDRLGRTVITMHDGNRFDSGIIRAPGEHTNPVNRAGIINKYKEFTHDVLGYERMKSIEKAVYSLDQKDISVNSLRELIYPRVTHNQNMTESD